MDGTYDPVDGDKGDLVSRTNSRNCPFCPPPVTLRGVQCGLVQSSDLG